MRASCGSPQSSVADDTGLAAEQHLVNLPRRQVVLTLAGVLLALLLLALQQNIVTTAMPRIITDLQGFQQYAWVVMAYMVASVTVTPVVGRLTDLFGRKWFCLGGIGLFLVASALCGASRSMPELIASRALQGLGAGTVMAVSFIVVNDLFPPLERAKYIALTGSVFAAASVIGPTAGGYITDYLSWRWVFFVNLPLGLVVALILLLFFPHIRPPEARPPIDYLGILTLVLALVPLLLALSWAGTAYAWTAPQVAGLLGFAFVMGTVFLAAEARAAEPVMPLGLFRNSIYAIASLSRMLTSFAMFGVTLFLPLFMQGAQGISASESGRLVTPLMLSLIAGSILSGQVLSRTGGHYRLQSLAGLVMAASGMYLLSRMDAGTSEEELLRNIVLTGLGLGTSSGVIAVVIPNAAPYRFLGVATASGHFFMSIGSSMGAAVLGSLMVNRFGSALVERTPEAVRQVIPADQLAALAHNAEALVNPQARSQLEAAFDMLGPPGVALFEQFLLGLRQSLATAIGEVFFVAAIVLALTLVLTLFLEEIPLRQRHSAMAEASSRSSAEQLPS